MVEDDGKTVCGRIMMREMKTNKTNDFPIGASTKKALREYLKEERKPRSTNEALFPSRKGGTPIRRDHAYRTINDAARAIGIKDNIGAHTMRKAFGYHAYQSGVDTTLIQKLRNHSAPSITLAYIGIAARNTKRRRDSDKSGHGTIGQHSCLQAKWGLGQ